MLNKIASLTLVTALVIALCGTSAFAGNSANCSSKTDRPEVQPPANGAGTKESPADEKLRTNVLKLVSDAKAGKIVPAARSQMQSAQRNNLSKGKKIAIGVGIVVAVIAVVLIVRSPILHDGR